MNAHAQPPHAQPPHAQPPHAQQAGDQGPGVDALTADIERLEAIVAHWDDSQRSVVFALRHAIDALHKAALRKLIGEVKTNPAALDGLRKAAADPLVYSVLRYHGLLQASLQERIERALASVRPMLGGHGGDVELVAFVPPDSVEVRFLGNCDGCSASTLTFIGGVKRAIQEHCPEIKQVRQVKGLAGGAAQAGFVSPFVETVSWSFALELDAIPDGNIATVTVDGEALLLARNGDVVACYHDACAHLGLSISAGAVSDGTIRCPSHGFTYDLMSGECLTAPEVQLRPVPLRISGGRVEVRLGG